MFSIITADGGVVEYDYDGDSFDGGDNCFYKYDGIELTDQGEGSFLVQSGGIEVVTYKVTLSGDTMTRSVTSENSSYSFTSVRTDLTESDFTPLCDDT